jgi:hypothetical protein
MKVLYIDHPEADFLSAVVYMGLVEELGPENVVDWPYKKSYHNQNHVYRSPYDNDPGDSKWNTWQTTNEGPMGFTSPFEWFRSAGPGVELTLDEIAASIGSFDLVVLASPRKYNRAALSQLISKVGRHSMRRLVMMDGEDYSEIRWDFVQEFSPSVYFKRELLPNPPDIHSSQRQRMQGSVRVVPFPFASVVPVFPPKPKDIDVMFLGGGTSPARQAAVDALRAEFGDRLYGGVNQHLSYSDYLDVINRSKIAICVRGFGYDTLRFWEIPSLETMMVSDRIPLIKPFPFEDGVHINYFDNSEHLVRVVQRWLGDEAGRQQIAKAGNQWLRQHHTGRARAKQLLEEATR